MNINVGTHIFTTAGRSRARLALGLALVVGCALASAQAFHNGSFMAGKYVKNDGYINVGNRSRIIDGWVVSGDIDWITSYWKASDGKHSLDLSGWNAGGISQTFSTKPGQSYRVMFDLSGNPEGDPKVKRMKVTIDGAHAKVYSFSVEGHTRSTMGWIPKVYEFRATKSKSTLKFTSLAAGEFGPALCHVRVVSGSAPKMRRR